MVSISIILVRPQELSTLWMTHQSHGQCQHHCHQNNENNYFYAGRKQQLKDCTTISILVVDRSDRSKIGKKFAVRTIAETSTLHYLALLHSRGMILSVVREAKCSVLALAYKPTVHVKRTNPAPT